MHLSDTTMQSPVGTVGVLLKWGRGKAGERKIKTMEDVSMNS